MGKKKSLPHSITMRARQGDTELEITGPADYVEARISRFLESNPVSKTKAKQASQERAIAPSSATAIGKKISLSQFLRSLSMKTAVDKVLAAGYYLEKHEDRQNYTAADIRQALREGKSQPPANINDAINKNIRKGLMMTAGDKEGNICFVLTSDGEDAIEKMASE